MDTQRIERLKNRLTIHFAIIAVLTAMLIAYGTGRFWLTTLIGFVAFTSYVFVDWLKLFYLGRVGTYFAMTFVTIVAIASYVYSVLVSGSESAQLESVASLLVYPECVLFLQKKNVRVFEQLTIFLLLEILVAAIINSNLIFGIFLTPILLLWVSALLMLNEYVALKRIFPEIDQPIPLLIEIISLRIKKFFGRSLPRHSLAQDLVVSIPHLQLRESHSSLSKAFPLGISALLFASLFFYFLPRSAATFRGTAMQTRVGLPKDGLMPAKLGRLLQDDTPVMRLSFRDEKTGQAINIRESVYLRAAVYDKYIRNSASSKAIWLRQTSSRYEEVTGKTDLRNRLPNTDRLIARFEIRQQFAETLVTLPPILKLYSDFAGDFQYDHNSATLASLEEHDPRRGRALSYEQGTNAWRGGIPISLYPAYEIAWLDPQPIETVIDSSTFRTALKQIAAEQKIDTSNPYQAAKRIEDYFSSSGLFQYSLDIKQPVDPNIDSIEDFFLNRRSGHCQLFASSMVAVLREWNIPSRIVVGYLPGEFNKYGYLVVKQSDAHAWVEALFSIEQLRGTELSPYLNEAYPYYWVYFDPTTSLEGGNFQVVRQEREALDYAERLWEQLVVESPGNNLSSSEDYGPSIAANRNLYKLISDKALLIRQAFESGYFSGMNIRFSWVVSVLFIAAFAAPLLLIHLARTIFRLAPSLACRLGLVSGDAKLIRETNFAGFMLWLQNKGIRRLDAETPQEFTRNIGELVRVATEIQTSSSHLSKAQLAELDQSLETLTQFYYKNRFGNYTAWTNDEHKEVRESTRKVKALISEASISGKKMRIDRSQLA